MFYLCLYYFYDTKCAVRLMNFWHFDFIISNENMHSGTQASSTDAVTSLKWDSLEDRRKSHRSSFTKKSLLNNVNTPNVRGNEIHTHDTRNCGKFRLPKSRTNWGQQRSYYYFLHELIKNNFDFY